MSGTSRVAQADFVNEHDLNELRLRLWPEEAKLEISITTLEGVSVYYRLRGEDLGKLQAWLQNPGYTLPR